MKSNNQKFEQRNTNRQTKKHSLTTSLISIFVLAIMFLCSCQTNDIDVKYIVFFDDHHSEIKSDTIVLMLNELYWITAEVQTDTQSKPKFFKQIDQGELTDIIESGETTLINETYGNGYRQNRRLDMDLNDSNYFSGQIIKYSISVNTKNGELKKDQWIKIK